MSLFVAAFPCASLRRRVVEGSDTTPAMVLAVPEAFLVNLFNARDEECLDLDLVRCTGSSFLPRQ